jgi:hypothetical protein
MMQGWLRLAGALLLAFAWLGAGGPVRALEIEFFGRAVKRDILALYDGRHEKQPHESRIHKFAEMPLNYLGYRLTYVDVNGPLPGPAELGKYRGLLTWFIEPMRGVRAYVDWLDKATATGLRYVFFSEMALPEPTEPAAPESAMRRVFARIGLEPTHQFVSITSAARITRLNPAMVGFERPLDKALPDFPVYLAPTGKASVHLSVETPTHVGVRNAVLIATSPGGGYVCDEFSTYFEPNTDRVRWILNPFAFFKEAFGEDRFPVPDVTTLSGRRIYFSHIDGDGWNNLTEIESYRANHMTSAEVIAIEAIEAYPDLPVSVGLIAGDIDPALGGRAEGAAIARRLFALPHVEVASHTYTHPFHWAFFDPYDREREQGMIDAEQRPGLPLLEQIRGAILDLSGKVRPLDRSNRYIAGSSDLPRTYLKLPFDLEKEVHGALKAAEALAPAGKRAKLYLWSGDTRPFEVAIHATRRAGVRNMNGGDSRIDAEYPSIFYVPPIARPVGKERQIYSGNSNENTYTNDWTGPFYGFYMLEHTLRNTETPRRLKPFNLYYHMYSGEKPAALAAVKSFLELARNSDVVPIEASEYAAIADDFFGVELQQIDLFAWAVTRRGAVQTVRFDDAEALAIDLAGSRGVLGSNRHAGSLYVSLDPDVERAVVALLPRAGAIAPEPASPVASLVHARWRLSGAIAQPCGVRAKAWGYGPGDMVWRALPGRAFRVVWERAGQRLGEEIRFAGDDGLVRFRAPGDGVEPVDLRIECHD